MNEGGDVQPSQELLDSEVHHATLPTPDCVNINGEGNETRNCTDTPEDKNLDKKDRQDIYNVIRKTLMGYNTGTPSPIDNITWNLMTLDEVAPGA